MISRVVIASLFLAFHAAGAFAEDGYQLWLRYAPVAAGAVPSMPASPVVSSAIAAASTGECPKATMPVACAAY